MVFLITVRWIDEDLREWEKEFEADTLNFDSVLLRMRLVDKSTEQMRTESIKKCVIYTSD